MLERTVVYEAVCDECEDTVELFANSMAEARKVARWRGWVVLNDRSAFCPEHDGAS